MLLVNPETEAVCVFSHSAQYGKHASCCSPLFSYFRQYSTSLLELPPRKLLCAHSSVIEVIDAPLLDAVAGLSGAQLSANAISKDAALNISWTSGVNEAANLLRIAMNTFLDPAGMSKVSSGIQNVTVLSDVAMGFSPASAFSARTSTWFFP